MSKGRKRLDNPNQLKLDFDRKIETYQAAREEVLDACQERQITKYPANRNEACAEIAVACKRAIRHSDMSREQIKDAINNYFGEPRLSIHMLNNYLSNPCRYPLPSYYIYAIQDVTGSLEPTQALAESMGARVITGAEIRQMALGKLDETILEMQRLKKELRGGRL